MVSIPRRKPPPGFPQVPTGPQPQDDLDALTQARMQQKAPPTAPAPAPTASSASQPVPAAAPGQKAPTNDLDELARQRQQLQQPAKMTTQMMPGQGGPGPINFGGGPSGPPALPSAPTAPTAPPPGPPPPTLSQAPDARQTQAANAAAALRTPGTPPPGAAPTPAPVDDLNDLTALRQQQAKDMAAQQAQEAQTKAQALQGAEARSDFGGMGLSGAAANLQSNTASTQDRAATLSDAQLRQAQQDEQWKQFVRGQLLDELNNSGDGPPSTPPGALPGAVPGGGQHLGGAGGLESTGATQDRNGNWVDKSGNPIGASYPGGQSAYDAAATAGGPVVMRYSSDHKGDFSGLPVSQPSSTAVPVGQDPKTGKTIYYDPKTQKLSLGA